MKEFKKLLVTFDYELFLGKNSGSVNNCIIKPTAQIASILKEYQVKAIFFVDTVYLLKLKDKSVNFPLAEKDYEAITTQLKMLAADGHYLFPHIHAHWYNAEYNHQANEWHLNDLSHYRFHSLDDSLKEKIFQKSIDLLNEIILPVNPDHTIDGYRAGGWCIQPFNDFKPYFEKHAIANDFSVAPGIKSNSQTNYHDFTNAKKHIYRFDDDVMAENENGLFCEFPVSTLEHSALVTLAYKIERKFLWKFKIKNSGDGNAAQFAANPASEKPRKLMSIDNMMISNLRAYKNFIGKNDYVHMVSHPKMISFYNITIFKKILNYVYRHYSVTSDFKTMQSKYVEQNSNSNRHKAELH